jgi:hypothetical protein
MVVANVVDRVLQVTVKMGVCGWSYDHSACMKPTVDRVVGYVETAFSAGLSLGEIAQDVEDMNRGVFADVDVVVMEDAAGRWLHVSAMASEFCGSA